MNSETQRTGMSCDCVKTGWGKCPGKGSMEGDDTGWAEEEAGVMGSVVARGVVGREKSHMGSCFFSCAEAT